MDEILVANFMVFHDLVSEERFDLWIGDEAWELDYYLHENPELKSAAYAWLTDFVGWLPMPDGGEHEAFLTADYNAEMIEHIARYPRVRDRAIFVGDPDDIVAERLGPSCRPSATGPSSTSTSRAIFPASIQPVRRPRGLRTELGYRDGRAGVHRHRRGLRRRRRSSAARHRELPRGQTPRPRAAHDRRRRSADQSSVPPDPSRTRGRAYVHDLYQHLAACDLAIVQGGLTTAMELTANRRPFIYFPLKHHFEQNFHVHHRLNATARAGGWTSTRVRPRRSLPRSRPRSAARSTTNQSPRTARHAPPPRLQNSSEPSRQAHTPR